MNSFIFSGNEAEVIRLIEADADLNSRDREGQSLMHYAARYGQRCSENFYLPIFIDYTIKKIISFCRLRKSSEIDNSKKQHYSNK